jgi:serine/threonine protein kinase
VKLRDIRVAVGGLASCYEVERAVTTELMSAEMKATQKKCWVQKCAVKTGKKDQCKSNLHAETLRHLDHPSVLRVLDMLQDQNNCYAVYEATEGHSAEELAERTGGINEHWASTIMRQVLAAVRHCNSKGLVLESLSLKHVSIMSEYIRCSAL